MKKITTLLLCLALGTACLTGCSNNDEPFTPKSYTAETTQVKEVNVDVRDRQIEVALSADDQIHIDYFESEKEFYDIAVLEDGVLTVTAASNKEWTDYVGGKPASDNRKILLQIPDRLLSTLQLATTNETISLPALTVSDDISLSTNNGDIEFDSLNAGKTVTLKNKNGNINGSILGSYDDYTIACDSKKGESNIPSSKEGGTKTLNVLINNGNIDIAFVTE